MSNRRACRPSRASGSPLELRSGIFPDGDPGKSPSAAFRFAPISIRSAQLMPVVEKIVETDGAKGNLQPVLARSDHRSIDFRSAQIGKSQGAIGYFNRRDQGRRIIHFGFGRHGEPGEPSVGTEPELSGRIPRATATTPLGSPSVVPKCRREPVAGSSRSTPLEVPK
jgi:hypothetical protein